MPKLAETLGQSCHIAVPSQGQIVVVARMESSADIGFVVCVGSRQPLASTVSCTVLDAYQGAQTQAAWERTLQPPQELHFSDSHV